MKSINKDILEFMYNKELKSMSKIAMEIGCSIGNIQYYIKKYKIKTRSYSNEMRARYNRGIPDFSKIPNSNFKALAWSIDCEGSIGFRSYKKLQPSISIAMSSKKFIEMLEIEFPSLFNKSYSRIISWKSYSWRMYDLRISSLEYIIKTLKRIIPYLTTKRNIAILLLIFCNRRTKWRKKNFKNNQLELDTKLSNYIRRMNMKKQSDEDRERIFCEALIFLKKNKINITKKYGKSIKLSGLKRD